MVILTNVLAYGLNWIISFITGISEEEVTDYSDKPENKAGTGQKARQQGILFSLYESNSRGLNEFN